MKVMATTADDKHWLDPPEWWRKVKPVRWILVVAVAGWAVQHFDLLRYVKLPERSLPAFLQTEPHPETGFYTRIEAAHVALADRFNSYDDLGTVTKTLSEAGYEGWTAASHHTPRSSAYPPYNFDTIVVEKYTHLDQEGKLTLSFFNNRLFEAEFDPADAASYAKQLRTLDLKPRVDENARAEKIEGDQRIVSTVELALSPVGKSLRTQPFVLWQDLRLIRARAAWDAKFGGIPIAAEKGE